MVIRIAWLTTDLYRSVPCTQEGHSLYWTNENGRLVVSGQTFTDRAMKPSVDRANLCDHDPSRAKQQPNAGVVKMIAKQPHDSVFGNVCSRSRRLADREGRSPCAEQ